MSDVFYFLQAKDDLWDKICSVESEPEKRDDMLYRALCVSKLRARSAGDENGVAYVNGYLEGRFPLRPRP